MIIFYFNKSKPNHHEMIKALHDSYRGNKLLMNTRTFPGNMRLNNHAKVIVFAGMIRGEGNIYKWCSLRNKRFLYIDHAYLDAGYKSDPKKEWMRITDSGFLWNTMEDRPADRWDAHFGSSYGTGLGSWMTNRDKKNILVLPPSLSTQWLFPESKTWLQQTLRELEPYTDKEIIIREKPLQPVIDQANNIVDKSKYVHTKTIDQELADAYMVASYNSAVTVKATMMGIPVFTSQNCAAAPMSIKLDQISDPPEPNRSRWLQQLVYHQFRTSEMSDGTVLDMLGIQLIGKK